MSPDFSLSVQYACPAPDLPRWRIRKWVRNALSHALRETPQQQVQLTIRIVDKKEGHELNLAWRKRDYATNVLTFEYGADPNGVISADIILCIDVLKQEAQAQNKTFLNHAAHLVTHGVLHGLGYDHIKDDEAREMEALETKILATQKIPDPYLER